MKLNVGRFFCCALLLGLPHFAVAQQPKDAVRAYEGRKLIFLAFGHTSRAEVRKDSSYKADRPCDVAVEVQGAKLRGRKVHLQLREIGELVVQGKLINCGVPTEHYDVTISGLDGHETSDELSDILGQFLFTPESYLQRAGIGLASTCTANTGEVLEEEAKDYTKPKQLLGVIPTYPALERLRRHEGVVKVQAIIGLDGCIHDPQIAQSVAPALDQGSLEVLVLWRYVPAYRAGQPVSLRNTFETSFKTF